MHSEKFLSRTHGEISKKVLLEKLQVQRSHRISDKNIIREKIGTHCIAALKRHENRKLHKTTTKRWQLCALHLKISRLLIDH